MDRSRFQKERMLDIASTRMSNVVLLPGDPLRAGFIAENFLDNPVCHNTSYGLLGYTGTYRGKAVSVQSTGMGTYSVSECTRELVEDYGCDVLIRIGSCASSNPDVHVGDIVISTACSNESSCHVEALGDYDYIPAGSFELISRAYHIARQKDIDVHVGVTGCSDILYRKPDYMPLLASEMEGVGFLYESSGYESVKALLMMTCGNHTLYRQEVKSVTKRTQDEFSRMLDITLDLAAEYSRMEGF